MSTGSSAESQSFNLNWTKHHENHTTTSSPRSLFAIREGSTLPTVMEARTEQSASARVVWFSWCFVQFIQTFPFCTTHSSAHVLPILYRLRVILPGKGIRNIVSSCLWGKPVFRMRLTAENSAAQPHDVIRLCHSAASTICKLCFCVNVSVNSWSVRQSHRVSLAACCIFHSFFTLK